jgi:predicted MPP superfamily phosphohydrolase
MRSLMPERFLFRHFFDGLALGGALAEWGLACWLLDLEVPVGLHLVVPALLAVVNRLAARRFEREPVRGLLTGRLGYVTLAIAFGALVSAGVLAMVASAWVAGSLLGALSAEAGMVARLGPAPIFGTTFRWIGGAAVGLAGGAVAYGYLRGYRELMVTAIDLPLRGLPAPVRLVHVSDLHLGTLADRAALREALDRVAALAPDLVCVTGDLVDSPATDLDAWMPELARLTARLGVFAVLGHNDRRTGADRVAAALARWSGWRLLRDEVATIEVAGGRLHLVGLEERPEGRAADALPALVARVPAGEPFVLLAHRPSVLPVAAAVGVPLVLAGHTHGGQLAVPGVPRLNVARLLRVGFEAGCYARDGTLLYVNRGLGTSGQRVRIGVPREISVLTLTPV